MKIVENFDVLKNPYFSIKIDPIVSSNYWRLNNEFKKYLILYYNKCPDYNLYTNNRIKRDGYYNHITFLSVIDLNLLKKAGISYDEIKNKLADIDINDLKYKGIGHETYNNNDVFFIVVESAKLDNLRKELNLGPKDFHITLGFNEKDIFNVRKNNPKWKISDVTLKMKFNFFSSNFFLFN